MDKIETIPLYDGCETKVKYSYPDNLPVDKLVIYVNGSGQSTYDNKRKNPNGGFFNYHDFFRNEFVSDNIAYCSYNTRGVEMGDSEPLFASINEDEYKKYKPLNTVRDIESIIRYLTDLPEFQNAKIILLGWSEGTIIAPLVAFRRISKVDALLLAGYCNENMKDVLIWQLSGNASDINLRKLFDKNNKGYISKEDFETADEKVKTLFRGLPFETFDRNSDGRLDVSDFASLQKPYLDEVLNAISRNDDEWLKNNFGAPLILTSGWFNEHFSLEPTKNILPQLDLPIYIFQGTDDANCSVQYAYDIKETFEKVGKTNLCVNIFDNHDHDLNFMEWLLNGTIPAGIKCIFDTVDAI
ncbi:MAG: hypothetical protein KBS45_02755 [Clostridiales bacterium]|nr:hypothetical protein [Candidatus Coliplasma caballi]